MRKIHAVAIAVCVSVILSACGEAEQAAEPAPARRDFVPPPARPAEDRQAVTDVVRSYFNALAAGDGKRVCSLMMSSARLEAAALGREYGAQTCAESVAEASKLADVSDRRELLNVDVADISVNGDTAHVIATRARREVRLAKTDDQWQILTVDILSDRVRRRAP